MNSVRLADNCNAAKERYCYMPTSKRTFREEWIASHELYLDESGRVYTPVLLINQELMMDAITGQLYKNGVCLSSSRLKLENVVRDQDAGAEKLRSYKSLT